MRFSPLSCHYIYEVSEIFRDTCETVAETFSPAAIFLETRGDALFEEEYMNRKEKAAERIERKQQKFDAGLLSARYPEVSSVVISMNYYQRNAGPAFMQRTVNFSPGSSAYFLMECMRHDCIDGGFNLDSVIKAMTDSRLESGNGELTCTGKPSGHTRIDYNISINYNK